MLFTLRRTQTDLEGNVRLYEMNRAIDCTQGYVIRLKYEQAKIQAQKQQDFRNHCKAGLALVAAVVTTLIPFLP